MNTISTLTFSAGIVLPLFVLIGLGYFLSRINLFNDNFLRIANKACFRVFLPTMLFYNISQADFSSTFDFRLIAFSLIVCIIIFVLLYLIVPRCVADEDKQGVIIQGIFRNNFLLFGIPVCQNIYGLEGAIIASVVAAFTVPLNNIMAVICLSKFNSKHQYTPKKILLEIITNPLVIGGLLGILFASTGIKLPALIEKPISQISALATPFALIVLGGGFKITKAATDIRYLVSTTFLRLVVYPAVTLPVAVYLGFKGMAYAALIALFAAPISVSSYTMSQHFDVDYDLAGELVVFSTIFSIFTIFFIIFISKTYGLI